MNLNYKLHFVGPLSNVDSSIQLLNKIIGNDFEIRKTNINNFVHFDKQTKSPINLGEKLSENHCCDSNLDVHYIHHSFEFKVTEEKDVFLESYKQIRKFEQGKFKAYLKEFMGLLKLFKEGNIEMSFEKFYLEFSEQGNFKTIASVESIHHTIRENFVISVNELLDLNEFILHTSLPFESDILDLAYQNYLHSYQIIIKNLQYLTLMNGLEVLFHPSNSSELRYRISRNLAVLIGKNEDDARDINSKMKKLYDKRSDIVHRGKADINDNDLLLARHYLRESIKKIYMLSLNMPIDKATINTFLTSKGFGDQIEIV